MVKVEVFVLPGCSRCSDGLDALKEVAASFGPNAFEWQERDLLQSIDDAVKLGILATPAIAINNQLAFTALPTPHRFQAELTKHAGS